MITLVPYVEMNGVRTVSDEIIKDVFQQMKIEKTLETVFYSGEVKNEQDLLAILKNRNNLHVFVLVDGVVGGFAWINGLKSNYAYAHFCFFKKTWGEHTQEIGKKLIEYWFSIPDKNGEPLFDVLIGIVPAFNKSAINFIQKLGLITIGEIPKMIKKNEDRTSATISYIMRE